ncbi:hypothetical protein FRACYDRAFT_247503 [Fragilariopsis cylindrus CCMP1102]|uniref:Uncharacterized protein n=1 Tax=Fragilariopsis cylindrus CCMP1102 TaxID=635003 RepID=A0A1E7EY00_9STRA|nr:hypothetical protein FRACYDRAFT_247503 [Fragilariopsis cylindrus CCMP1102]|eukprot:OEU10413.1 hypothetical protein FRACYDRAFT_247503 [Fragilariopsis cylindrus CCMP1102]
MADNNNGNNNNDERAVVKVSVAAATATLVRLANAVRDAMNNNELGNDPYNNEILQQIKQNLIKVENHFPIEITAQHAHAAVLHACAARLAILNRDLISNNEQGDNPRNNKRRQQIEKYLIYVEKFASIEIKAQRARDKLISLIQKTDEFPLLTKDKINELIGNLPSSYIIATIFMICLMHDDDDDDNVDDFRGLDRGRDTEKTS